MMIRPQDGQGRIQEKEHQISRMSVSLEWGYDSHNGPDTWPSQYPQAAGEKQSPIDIQPVSLKTLKMNKNLQWKYVPENCEELSNTGTAWKVHVNGKGSELVGGPLEGTYILEQFHCHWGEKDDEGSEHTIDGQRFAGELHLVHWNSKYSSFAEAAEHPDGLCVLGIFLKPGKSHAELQKLVVQLPKVEFKGEKMYLTEPVDPALFIPEDNGYYTYQGSLTTPPCSECVIWIVFKEPVEISQEQLAAFRNMKSYPREAHAPSSKYNGCVKRNYRPTVPIGQREVVEVM
ncbi:unnamed protein product [Callosobruchus maculatus]|uniref:Carbonic anhydrase n=2 Tax=Callosobruchus maculatus TaxID=64391 RepID=A0A653DWF3_CALMS|nr:unnamed protein product [Callosobruchus maculatus]